MLVNAECVTRSVFRNLEYLSTSLSVVGSDVVKVKSVFILAVSSFFCIVLPN